MTKIMLVEDDKSLREIYGVRLLAEGYDIVSAGDGEEALAMAIKERPQLIVSDVMMPKISGFDLLDILRSTTETRNIRVIMMTALSSEDQRLRGEQLGADRYLVKSQVGIEDVVRVVHEVLEDGPAATTAANPPAATQSPLAPSPAAPAPNPIPKPTTPQQPAPQPPVLQQSQQPQAPVALQQPLAVAPAQPQPQTLQTPGSNPLPVPTGAAAPAKPPQARARVISPLNDPTINPVNINELLDKEIAKEAGLALDVTPVQSAAAQQNEIIEQLDQFQPVSLPEPMSPSDTPGVTIDSSGTISGAATQADLPQPSVQPPTNQPTTVTPPPPMPPQAPPTV